MNYKQKKYNCIETIGGGDASVSAMTRRSVVYCVPERRESVFGASVWHFGEDRRWRVAKPPVGRNKLIDIRWIGRQTHYRYWDR